MECYFPILSSISLLQKVFNLCSVEGVDVTSLAADHHIAVMKGLAYSTDPEGDARQIQSSWDSRWMGVRPGMIQPGVQTRTNSDRKHTSSNREQEGCR
ncbi:hypothetical protein ElyMa_000537200 [Elysia marginata]|uniref:Uncharacterized protein n=1 Tax=Elysia marginata TaxID=1093978 RepID=A0AAV4G1T1_9GAST|nr:hypothetical protein ElyMa_000537200 [Elysia marginata]